MGGLAPALVLLSDRDTDAPDLPGVCTVSKDDVGDHGAYALGCLAALRGALWVDRPYYTGNPSVEWMVAKAERVIAAGGYCQVGNEPNHPDERWEGGPRAYADFFGQVAARVSAPERLLHAPLSPGFDGWRAWIDQGYTARLYAVHAYGSAEQMQEVVQWYLDRVAGDLFVSECNPGAGNVFDLNAWAGGPFKSFLDWCAPTPRLRLVAYFAHSWDQSPRLPSSIDARGTAVVDVLRTWRPPAAASPSPQPSSTGQGSGAGSPPTAPQPTPGSEEASVEDPNIGRGLWVWYVAANGGAAGIVDKARQARARWIAVKGGDGPSRWDQLTPELVAEIKRLAPDLAVWAWTYGYGGRRPSTAHGDAQWSIDDEVRVADDVARVPGLAGYVVDVEAEWRDQDDPAGVADRFGDALRASCDELGILFAYAPLPVIDYHQALPWVQFNRVCDLAMPQLYAGNMKLTSAPSWTLERLLEQWTRWRATWEAAGLRVPPLAPIGDAYELATGEDVALFERTAVEQEWAGWSYWSADHCRPEHLAAMAAADRLTDQPENDATLNSSSPVKLPPTPAVDPIDDALNNLFDLTLQTDPQPEERRRSAQLAISVIKDALKRGERR